MMSLEIKLKWLTALRSGEYKQTKETLRDCKGFCCLGVLTDIYIKEKRTEWGREVPTESHEPVRYFFSDGEKDLPNCVKHWAGLEYCDPLIRYEGEEMSLSQLNDTEGLDFNQIAAVIEEHL